MIDAVKLRQQLINFQNGKHMSQTSSVGFGLKNLRTFMRRY